MTTIVSCVSALNPQLFTPVKARQQAMWASGDFAVIGTTLQIVGESLCVSEHPNPARSERLKTGHFG